MDENTKIQFGEMQNNLVLAMSGIDALNNSSTIPRQVETAFRQRLGLPKMIWGSVTLASGVFVLNNGQITATSIPLITATVTGKTFKAVPALGKVTFTCSDLTDTSVLYYFIICQ